MRDKELIRKLKSALNLKRKSVSDKFRDDVPEYVRVCELPFKQQCEYFGLTLCKKNLDVDKFRNGELIPHANTPKLWKQATLNRTPAWCYYNNDPKNGEKYGKLYNWYAVNDPRGLAPEGYHIPMAEELKCIPNAIHGGYYTSDGFLGINCHFSLIGHYGYLWVARHSNVYAFTRCMLRNGAKMFRVRDDMNKLSDGLSVRCAKNII